MALTNAYTTLNAVKAALRISDNVDDTLLEFSINSASRLIDGYCNRAFYNQGTAARVFAGTAITLQTDAQANGSFEITWSTSDYQLEPLNGISNGQASPFTRIRATLNYLFPTTNDLALVKVTGVWAWPAIPAAVETACIIQSQRIFKRFDSPLGVVGFGDMGAIRVSRQLDPDVAELVSQYRKMEGTA